MNLKVGYSKRLKNYFIKFPDKLLKELKWKEGDKIEWKENKDGSFSLFKINEN